MSKTTSQAFIEFLQTITPSDAMAEKMDRRRHTTHDYLVKSFGADSEMPLTRTDLIGSAAKRTVTSPVDDIDVLAVFSNENGAFSKYGNAQDFLSKVRNALSGSRIETVGARGQAVRLFYKDNLHVDIAPVIPLSGGGYYLPGGDGSWITTDPSTQITWFNGRNQELGGHLRFVVMVLKEWNKAHGKHLKSFHLETMVATMFSSLDSNYREAVAMFFAEAQNYIKVQDPAGHSGDLSSRLTFQQWLSLTEALSAAGERAQRALYAEANGNHEEAIRLWTIILGSRFPKYI